MRSNTAEQTQQLNTDANRYISFLLDKQEFGIRNIITFNYLHPNLLIAYTTFALAILLLLFSCLAWLVCFGWLFTTHEINRCFLGRP